MFTGYMRRDVLSGLHNENHIFWVHEFLTIQATLFLVIDF